MNSTLSGLPQRLQEALNAHIDSIEQLRALTVRLETATAVPRDEAEQVLSVVLDRGRRLRELLDEARTVLSKAAKEQQAPAEPAPESIEELTLLVLVVRQRVTEHLCSLPREWIQRLVAELDHGTIAPRPHWRTSRFDDRKKRALNELRSTLEAGDDACAGFPCPGDSGQSWLQWFWALDLEPQDKVAETLTPRWPDLVTFLDSIGPTEWITGNPKHADPTSECDGSAADHRPNADDMGADLAPSEPSTVAPRHETKTNDAKTSADLPQPLDQGDGPGDLRSVLRHMGVGSVVDDLPAERPHARSGITAPEPVHDDGDTNQTEDDDRPDDSLSDPQPAEHPHTPAEDCETVGADEGEVELGDEAPPGVQVDSAEAPTGAEAPKDTEAPKDAEAPDDADAPNDVMAPAEADVDDPSTDTGDTPLSDTPSPADSNAPPEDAPPQAPPILPAALHLEEFLESYWLDRNGQPEAAPWTRPSFNADVVQGAAAAIIAHDWPAAYVFASAAETLDVQAVATPRLLDQVRAFGQGRTVGDLPDRDKAVNRLMLAVKEARTLSDSPADWVSLALLVLAQRACPLDYGTVGNLAELAELSEPTTALLQEWLVVSRGGRVVEQLRDQIEGPPPSVEDHIQTLNDAQNQLHTALKRLYQSAGGSVQRTHCRAAWDQFMQLAHRDFTRISKGDVQPNDASLLDDLRKRATKLFDKRGAKFQDRRHMDKAVDELLGLAHNIVQLHQEIARLRAAKGDAGNALEFTEKALLALSTEHRQSPSVSGWIGRLVWSHVHNERTYAGATDFDNDCLLAAPLLVECWDDVAFGTDGLDARQVARPVIAAARLLEAVEDSPVDDCESWLAAHRPDLLPLAGPLQPESVRLRQEYQARVEDRQHALAAHFRDLKVQLAELADNQREIAVEALRRIDEATDRPLSAMELAWLESTEHRLAERVRLTTEDLVARAKNEGRDPEEVDRMAESQQLAGLLRILGKKHGPTSTGQLRATELRKAAERRWPNPAMMLSRIANANGEQAIDERSRPIVQTWLDQRHVLRRRKLEPPEAAALREAFAEFVFQMTAKRRKNRVRAYTPQGANTHYHQLDLDDVRAWLVEDVGNPTFLPQLARYRTLSIKVAPVSVRERTLPRRIHQEAVKNEITIVLAPGLEPDQRNPVRDHLGTQPYIAPIAVLDDLDLCRILNPDGEAPDPLLAVLEIVAEQQPWSRFCPYEVVEGQHVRLEMFVGRMKEAERLARQATYGRVFSGRRLGKTALLRFVQGHPQFKTLPSGNTLHVVFCSIAGEESEDAVSRSIIRSVRQHMGLPPIEHYDNGDAVAHLKEWLPTLLRERPNDSWLILLDEADSFFGDQISSPAGDSQKTLSWWMSRHSEQITDRNGTPRVRFVFCGYLRTDQNRGVWENKGDVLLLRPLDPQDAVQLAAGPLARIGIDARAQADNIAFQCGYQPAVLVRFGLTLVEHLERTRAVQEREGVCVEPKDVVDVFLSNGVQKAINEACWLNFVGHPTGQLVFAAFLMELRSRVPSAALDDVPRRILDRVKEVKPDFDPADYFADNWVDLVTQQLKELVDRSLLFQVDHRPSTYRLQFPHHLPVLLQQDPGQRVQDSLTRLRTTGNEFRTQWVISQPIIEAMRFSLGPEGKQAGIRAVFVASQWQEPLRDPSNGLGPRVALGPKGAGPDLLFGPDAEEMLDQLAEVDEPILLVGGPSAARKAIAAEDESGEVEVARTARLTSEQILAWLQRRRAAEFTGLDVPLRIMQLTGGIPILVGAFDDALTQTFSKAPTLGDAEFATLVQRVEEAIPKIRARLFDATDPYGLRPRELELLQMVCAASDEYRDRELMVEAIREGLVELPDGVSPYRAEDGPAVRMLLALGLLPRASTGQGPALEEVGLVPVGDPLLRLIEQPRG